MRPLPLQGSRAAEPSGPPPVGYLVVRYPTVSHAFIVREVHELRRQGVGVETFSIWRSKDHQVLSALDQREFDRTRALLPPRLTAYARAHSRALIASPRGYLRSALHCLAVEHTRIPWTRARPRMDGASDASLGSVCATWHSPHPRPFRR